MGVKVIWLEAINHRRAFPDRAVGEPQDGHRAGRILIRGENRMPAFGRVARAFLAFASHAKEQCIERMTASGQQRAAAKLALRVPAVLAVPRTDAVIVIDLTLMDRADEPGAEDRFGVE